MNRIRPDRKFLRPSIAVILAALLATAAAAADFRQFDWGAAKQEIRRQEKLPLHHDLPDEIAYWNFELAGVNAGLIYKFEDGRLVKAYYLSRHRTADPAEDYADYRTFQRHFDHELGPHVEEIWVWQDGGEHSEQEQALEAVTSGRPRLVTRWDVEDHDVKMVMTGEDGAIQTIHVYFEPLR